MSRGSVRNEEGRRKRRGREGGQGRGKWKGGSVRMRRWTTSASSPPKKKKQYKKTTTYHSTATPHTSRPRAASRSRATASRPSAAWRGPRRGRICASVSEHSRGRGSERSCVGGIKGGEGREQSRTRQRQGTRPPAARLPHHAPSAAVRRGRRARAHATSMQRGQATTKAESWRTPAKNGRGAPASVSVDFHAHRARPKKNSPLD